MTIKSGKVPVSHGYTYTSVYRMICATKIKYFFARSIKIDGWSKDEKVESKNSVAPLACCKAMFCDAIRYLPLEMDITRPVLR